MILHEFGWVALLLLCFVIPNKAALLCGTTLDISPRITCPSSKNVSADPITCNAVVTWDDFQYFPSPFFSSGVDNTPQRNKISNGSPDLHFSFQNAAYGTPLAKGDDYPTAECKTIGVANSLFDLLNLGGQRFRSELIIDLSDFDHSNVQTNFYVSVEGFFDPFLLNGVTFANSFDPTGLRPLSIPPTQFQAGQNVLRVTSVSQSFLPILGLLPTSADFTVCLSGVASPKLVGYTDDCYLDGSTFSITHQSGDTFPITTTSVTASVIDSISNTASCQFSVSVYDGSPPDISGCIGSLSLSLDGNGQAVLTPSNAFTFPPSDCSGWDFATSDHVFDCAQSGTTVQVSTVVNDRLGLQSVCQTNVMISDELDPDLSCHSSVTLEPGVIQSSDLVIATSDNCGSVSITLSQTALICPSTSPVIVVVNGTDPSGNVAQCSVVIDVNCPSITSTPTVTPSTSQSLTHTAASTPTSSPSFTSTSTLTPSTSFTSTSTSTPSPSSTGTSTLTPSLSPTGTPTQTPSPSFTSTSTQTPSPSSTGTPTQTPSPSFTSTSTQTPSPSSTGTPTQTPSPSFTFTPPSTPTGSVLAPQTALRTPASTSAVTANSTPTNTPPQTPANTPAQTPARSPPQSPMGTIVITLIPSALSTPSATSLKNSNMLGPVEETDSDIPISQSPSKSRFLSAVILPSRSPRTSVVIIYDQNNDPIGSVTLPPEYQDHELVYEVLPPNSQTASPVIDLSLIDAFGNEVFNFIQNLEICIQPFSNINIGDSCLGFQKVSGQFTCEDSCLDTSGDSLCGKTDHFTSFALLLNHPSHDPAADGCEQGPEADRIILWLSVAFVCLACCLVIMCMAGIEVHYRKTLP